MYSNLRDSHSHKNLRISTLKITQQNYPCICAGVMMCHSVVPALCPNLVNLQWGNNVWFRQLQFYDFRQITNEHTLAHACTSPPSSSIRVITKTTNTQHVLYCPPKTKKRPPWPKQSQMWDTQTVATCGYHMLQQVTVYLDKTWRSFGSNDFGVYRFTLH